MPVVSSYADIIRDWEALLIAIQEHTQDLPSVETHRAALEAMVTKVKAIKARQDTMASNRQGATQELQAAIAEGRELSIRLRGAVKADLGPKSERLGQFGVAPIRKRRRRSATKPDAPTAPPQAPTAPPQAPTPSQPSPVPPPPVAA